MECEHIGFIHFVSADTSCAIRFFQHCLIHDIYCQRPCFPDSLIGVMGLRKADHDPESHPQSPVS